MLLLFIKTSKILPLFSLYIHGGYNSDYGCLSDFYRLNLQSERNGFKW